MAAVIQTRVCSSCKTSYRTKLKKGKDTRTCPECKKDNSPGR